MHAADVCTYVCVLNVFCAVLCLLFRRKSASQELSTLLKEKEEQITGLMEEGRACLELLPLSLFLTDRHTHMHTYSCFFLAGEKLSKKELQNSNIIKKLKEKNKQNDQLLTAQRSNNTA